MSDTTPTILIADDHDDLRQQLVTALSDEGFHTIAADNGETALREIIQNKPALALIDIRMPKLSGLEVLREMRAHTESSQTHVILLTANDDMESVSQALDFGGAHVEYLVKADWTLADIIKRVKERLQN